MILQYKKLINMLATALFVGLMIMHQTHTIFKPSFHESMCITNKYKVQEAKQDAFWNKIIDLYNKNPFDNPPEKTYFIPRIIHHIWLGSKLPQISKEYGQTWREKNPGWIHILWTDDIKNYNDFSLILSPSSFDEIVAVLNDNTQPPLSIIINIQNLSFCTRDQYMNSKNFGEKSDILRYEILFHCGGLYTDTDFKCIQSFDSLHKACTFYTGLNYSSRDFCVFNGLMGSTPRHPICKECIENIQGQTLDRPNKEAEKIMARTGPYLLSSIVRRYITKTNDDTIVLFPVSFFYPFPSYARNNNSTLQEIEKKWLRPESLAIHFWHVSWDPGA